MGRSGFSIKQQIQGQQDLAGMLRFIQCIQLMKGGEGGAEEKKKSASGVGGGGEIAFCHWVHPAVTPPD